MKRWVVALAFIGALHGAWAQALPDRAIKARQSSYFLMGQQMARINGAIRGDLAFDKAALETSVEALELIGRLVVDYYPAGSNSGASKAKPEVWSEATRFKQLAQVLQSETTKLKAAVRGGDLDAIKEAFGSTAKSCKACHDTYRSM